MATNTVTWGNGYAVSRTGGRLAIIRNTKVFVITYPYLVYVHIYMSTHSREMFAMSDAKRELRTALKIVSRHFNNNPAALKKAHKCAHEQALRRLAAAIIFQKQWRGA